MWFPSCRTLCNGRMAWDAIKNRNTHHAKNTTHASILLFACIAFFCAYNVCIASIVLRTTAWKLIFNFVFCILTAAALFQRSARVRQPAIDKFMFHDGWAVCDIRRSTLVRDIIIKAPALNKWTPVSASTCVAGWRADVLEVGLCQIINSVMGQRPLSPCTASTLLRRTSQVLFTPTCHVLCDVCLYVLPVNVVNI